MFKCLMSASCYFNRATRGPAGYEVNDLCREFKSKTHYILLPFSFKYIFKCVIYFYISKQHS